MSRTTKKFSPDVRERAVRLVLDNEGTHRCSPWRSLKVIEYATLEWVGWFNN